MNMGALILTFTKHNLLLFMGILRNKFVEKNCLEFYALFILCSDLTSSLYAWVGKTGPPDIAPGNLPMSAKTAET